MDPIEIDDLRSEELRRTWNRYLDRVRPFRPLLHAYCRGLTSNLWDADDLVQETLIRGFHSVVAAVQPIENPRAYLLRIASHAWIDEVRRRETERRLAPEPDPEPAPPNAGEAREAGERLFRRLAPRERAAVLLKELFGMRLDEIANVLETTVGAVKSALHRGRERLREPEGGPASRRPSASRQVVDRFVELYNAKDMEGLKTLVLETAAVSNVGPGNPYGGEAPATRDSFFGAVAGGHPSWDDMFAPKSERVLRAEFEGEHVVLLLRVPSEKLGQVTGVPGEAIESVFVLEEDDGHVSRLIAYTFSPETIRTVGEGLGYAVRTGLYRPPEG